MLLEGTYLNTTIQKSINQEGRDVDGVSSPSPVRHCDVVIYMALTLKGQTDDDTAKLIEQIPETSEAVQSLAVIGTKKATASADEPNTFELKCKATFPEQAYEFSIGEGYPSVVVVAKVKGHPVIKVVDGIVGCFWKLEATIRCSDMDMLSYLSKRNDIQCTVSAEPTEQQLMDFIDVGDEQHQASA